MSEKAKVSLASKFLVGLVVLIALFAIAIMWAAANPMAVMRGAFVPSHTFAEDAPNPAPDYSLASAWYVKPGQPSATSGYLPEGLAQIAMVPEADVFFIHPTTYVKKARWNATFDHEEAASGVEGLVIKHQATAFSGVGQLYVPRYRQATFGAFLAEGDDGWKAVDKAYQDVLTAFDHYVNNDNNGRPFILAAHSQGSLHGLRLLKDRISGTELADRMIGAWLIGWPISIEEDLGALPDIHACADKTDTGCVVSFLSFAPDADTSGFQGIFDTRPGLSGNSRAGSTLLCSDPLTWIIGGGARDPFHRGGVAFTAETRPMGEPILGLTGTKCSDDGYLRLTRPPMTDVWRELEAGPGSYHVYDYNLFYMNIRENASERARAWFAAQ